MAGRGAAGLKRDFLSAGERIPVEIKFGISTRRNDLRSLTRFIEQERCPCGILVNNADEVCMLTNNIVRIPAACL